MPARIAVAGGGVVGALVAGGLCGRDDVEVLVLERSPRGAQLGSGTGLNIGPNAVKALATFMPAVAERLRARSLPWHRWTVALTDGTPLARFDLDQLADNPGLRIGWAELYAALREPVDDRIAYGCTVAGAAMIDHQPVLDVLEGSGSRRLGGIDLLVGADGRYSPVRDALFEPDATRFAGVGLFRLLLPADEHCPIEDYAQWFNGPARLLAFRIPGDLVYCAGSFPIAADQEVPESEKQIEALSRQFCPNGREPCAEVAFLLAGIAADPGALHWARLQDRAARFCGPPRVVLAGDAAHPMLPTLGQGATQAIEDACVLVDEIRIALDGGEDIALVPERFARRRAARIGFATELSREATDTMLAGGDPVAGTQRKLQPAFLARLQQLFRDAPVPR